MAKRITAEEKILEYFQTADLNKVEVVYNLAHKVLKTRQVAAAPAPVKAVKTRKPRTKKAPASAPAAEPMTAGASA